MLCVLHFMTKGARLVHQMGIDVGKAKAFKEENYLHSTFAREIKREKGIEKGRSIIGLSRC